jgi:hypothetical protein
MTSQHQCRSLPAHLFVSDVGGALHDTRDASWLTKPLRANYRRHHERVTSVADLKAVLRAGGYAWPGGYPLYFLDRAGDTFSFDGVRANFREYCSGHGIGLAIADLGLMVDVNWDDETMFCMVTGKPIECAYFPPTTREEN